MPVLETFKVIVARFSDRKPLVEDSIHIPNPSQVSTATNPVKEQPSHSISPSVGTDQVINSPGSGNTHAAAVEPGSSIGGLFTNAHGFTINNPTMISQSINEGTAVLKRLAKKAMSGAIHDSSDRSYPPLCHPDTRKSLRSRIVEWGMGKDSQGRMLWMYGPPAVGKSAVAQTTAEFFQSAGRLGATFFFSRPNQFDDPSCVIPTLAYQLATKHHQYKHIITQRLADDPLILKKNIRTQFKELIIQPFRILMTQYPQTISEPLLIILDGLDECKDKQAQCEFIDLISTHSRQVGIFPVFWLITSRPEWHLRSMLSNPDFHTTCKREELEVDDKEAQNDVRRLLRDELEKTRKKYRDRLPSSWPPEQSLRQIAVAASGHLGFASFLLRFIDDEQYSNPQGQLQVCMTFLGGGGTVGAINPLHALDLLYRKILTDIPADVLPTTMRILGLLIIYSPRLSTEDQARFLNLDQADFHRALQQLHSVIYVPSMDDSNSSLRVYHASFSDFLKDTNRCGSFSLDEEAVHYDVALHSLDLMEDIVPASSALRPSVLFEYLPHVSLRQFSESTVWKACCKVSRTFVPGLVSRLEDFDFTCLKHPQLAFEEFLRWLYSLGCALNKSLICLVEKVPVDHTPANLTVSPESPSRYLTTFIPGVDSPKFPYKLRLRLGNIDQVYVSLEVSASHSAGTSADDRRSLDSELAKMKQQLQVLEETRKAKKAEVARAGARERAGARGRMLPPPLNLPRVGIAPPSMKRTRDELSPTTPPTDTKRHRG
ncbi:hypothetical protein P691DRAFT_810256 [Macrolepiota fuliginosa MF-IS2]|uniref:Nephrocystin 3-like N-terminal domain-containing protein n=1 Tax=Macrolepiota fuliginosa MF-IS2 TaxID=1400762 RepID=A0A9P6BYP9_9AGAR|nr:hypothetical protein P691DRAFT_810256 [Macrolepiota fuliginosa MF-IS2]